MRVLCAAAAVVLALAPARAQQGQAGQTGQGFSFRSNVDLINVTATVTDSSGRFVSGLTRDDFEIYEDGVLQPTSHFETERVPVSLGIVVDTSGSMVGERWVAAQSAINRFLNDLLGSQDEVFLYRFDNRPELVQPWTSDRRAASRKFSGLQPRGGTAMYDAVAEAIPLAQQGTKRKKALVVISDGNDTNSRMKVNELTRLIQESELLVYAVGIEASGGSGSYSQPSAPQKTSRPPSPSPFPGRKVTTPPPTPAPTPTRSAPPRNSGSGSDRANETALRAMTDDSGGRTEMIYSPQDLDPATAGIASELSQQYFLGYNSAAPKDGRWHTIEVRVKKGPYTIRARKGFIAG
ncbi:MAG TPA: VWA domain-containing protein [Vicinamibacterales bacterium]|nr:VWA domain-containing protein [Vicinamibacterales bacterium]